MSRQRGHHEAFLTPGSLPSLANRRKQMRHMPNERMKARARPQGRLRHTTGQRFTLRLEYFGFLFAFAISDLRATCAALSSLPADPYLRTNGMPSSSSSRLPSSSVRAEVTIFTCSPRTRSMLSKLTSGKISCSVSPSA
jgi:hypothetical protein